MNQTSKELLIKDLCARLPYGVKASTKVGGNIKISFMGEDTIIGEDGDSYDVSFITPYLFPMSSMTEEQKKYITDRWGINDYFDFEINPDWGEYFVELGDTIDFINWLNKNHFDYRGLIEKDLALDATGLNIY